MIILQGLSAIIGIVAFVCYILVVVKMFQAGDTGLGLTCAIGILACGLGVLVAFIMGWVKSGEYGIMPIMLTWTGCIGANIALNLVGVALQGMG